MQLADAMGQSPLEVSKWLGGLHNLTLENIVKMETALGIDLIHCE
ncbi:MAG: helix-turn-helix transcriptional regulator [Saprospiraceae bacterium]|nr:helix-turn-helix transcriptional regulator [Saprospiraceae bacterium]